MKQPTAEDIIWTPRVLEDGTHVIDGVIPLPNDRKIGICYRTPDADGFHRNVCERALVEGARRYLEEVKP